MKFTVLGSSGFIGGHLVRHLRAQSYKVDTPPRNFTKLSGNAGHVIYAIGMTGNFRQNPDATIDAHVNVLLKALNDTKFESFLYLSSARVYAGLKKDTSENAILPVKSGPDVLYDLSKLLGESICLGIDNPAVRVTRLSNVYGYGMNANNFLGSIIADVKKTGRVKINESPKSSKDYVFVDDVTKILQAVVTKGKKRLYNVASGVAVTHNDIAKIIKSCGYKAEFKPKAVTRVLPAVNIGLIKKEFGIKPRCFLDDLPALLKKDK